jgi:hypothetical protein
LEETFKSPSARQKVLLLKKGAQLTSLISKHPAPQEDWFILGLTTLHNWLLFRIREGLTLTFQQGSETQGFRNMKLKETKL